MSSPAKRFGGRGARAWQSMACGSGKTFWLWRAAPMRGSTARAWLVTLLLAFILSGLDIPATPFAPASGVRVAAAQGDFGFPFFDPPRRRERRALPQQERGSGFFPFFDWGQPRYRAQPEEPTRRRPPRRAVHSDPTRPPAPAKRDADAAKTVLVFGDTLADWLAYGLEEAFEDANEFAATRKIRHASSLIQNEPRDFDWVQYIHETLAAEKADFIVMMAGLSDRHAIKERPPAKPAAPLSIAPGGAAPPANPPAEPQKPKSSVTHDFRSDTWAELYAQRIAAVMAALRSKRVPVIWVGLPPIRGPKSRADLSFINDIFRAEAQKAGVVYVDVWEGFLDESGDYSTYGPDVMGQVRRLRSSDGTYFTKAGARKLAHFVDREIKRLLERETPIALPVPDMPEKVPDDLLGPAPRPVAGPVVPLTGASPAAGEALLGGAASRPRDPESVAAKVLVNGDPVPPAVGRADNFAWPPPQSPVENSAARSSGAAPSVPTQGPDGAAPPRKASRSSDAGEMRRTLHDRETGQSASAPPAPVR